MNRGTVRIAPVLMLAAMSLVLSMPAYAGIKIADNPGITVGGTGETFDFIAWHGWWVRYGSTYIDFTFNGLDPEAIPTTHVLVNFDLLVTNHSSGESGLDGLVDIVINPGEAAGSTYTLANVLFDNVDPFNHVYGMGSGSYGTHASILVDKNYILNGTLVIRVVRHTDQNGAPVAPICTNQPIDMSTQPPTIPPNCYEENDAHTVHIFVRTTDATGTVADNDQVALWRLTDSEIIRHGATVTVGGSGQDFDFSAWHGWWVRYGSTYIDFEYRGLDPAKIPDRFLLVVFGLGVTNRSGGETGLDGLVDFTINPGELLYTYTVASELLDNMDHLNHVYALGGGGTYTTIAVLSINKDYIRGGKLVIRVNRYTDTNGAPIAPICTNQPIDMSNDPPTIPPNCYENDEAERIHIYVRTTDASGRYTDAGVATIYSKHFEATAVLLTSFSAVSREDHVEVNWTTASEFDNAGFNIYRSAGDDGTKQKLNQELIPARGSGLEGATYTFKDYDVSGGRAYYYWFEDVSLDGETRMSGPVLAQNPDTPRTYGLAQNHPNPFNPATEIAYELAADCHVKLEVYNVLGQRVATLVDEYQSAGSRVFHWNAGPDISSGIYFYRLQAGSFVEMRKMVILR